jgi:N-acetylmuramic acid 6-phosphate etherase
MTGCRFNAKNTLDKNYLYFAERNGVEIRPESEVVGIAACGITPFVRGAIARARAIGASTVFITCAPEVARGIKADVVINPVVGPEVITGSTRMKAGTATKLVLNTLTTSAMIRLGKVHGNLMIDLRATNAKLRDRAERIVMTVTGLTREKAHSLLRRAGGSSKVAILMHERKLSRREALARLASCEGSLRRALMRESECPRQRPYKT